MFNLKREDEANIILMDDRYDRKSNNEDEIDP